MIPSVPSIEPKFSIPAKPYADKEQVNLEFKVKGHPEPKVTFYKNNRLLQPNESVDISKGFQLTATYLKEKDLNLCTHLK